MYEVLATQLYRVALDNGFGGDAPTAPLGPFYICADNPHLPETTKLKCSTEHGLIGHVASSNPQNSHFLRQLQAFCISYMLLCYAGGKR
jgi:hypothetical protein